MILDVSPTSFTERTLRRKRAARILLVGHKPAAASLVRKLIQSVESDAFQITQADMPSQALPFLQEGGADVVLLDLSVPGNQDLEGIRLLKAQRPAVPTVVFTDPDDPDMGKRALQAGADDFLIQGRPDGESLVRALQYAIERHAIQAELAKRTEAFQRTNKELERLNHVKMEFLSVVSHELRTPLTVMRGFIRNLMDGVDGSVTEDQLHTLQRVDANLDRLRDLVDDLLDYQKLQGDQAHKVAPVDIERLLHHAAKNLEGMTRERDIRIFVETGSRFPTIHADKVGLLRAIENLLSNAVKFSPDHSAIRVRTLSNPRAGILRISVIDQGIGIREEDQEKVFEPFSQIDQSDHRVYGGTGLGLSIVKRIIEMHGGHVSVESVPGKGSTFSILLPARGRASGKPSPGLPKAPSADAT
jgi:signal transduction histidine kinase